MPGGIILSGVLIHALDKVIALRLGYTGFDARGRPKEVSAAMKKVVASCKDKGIVDQAKRYIKK